MSVLFAREGAQVVLIDRVAEPVAATQRLLEAEGAESLVLEADVADVAACAAAVEAAVRRFSTIHVLVNNVGVPGPGGDALEVDLDAWDHAMSVNVKSMVQMARFCVPEMRKAGGGSIINLSSVAGLMGGFGGVFYAASKGAVVNMTRAMATHHGPDGIRVNCIAPGFVYTPFGAEGLTPEEREQRRLSSLLKTEGTAWDIAEAALYLASDAARWITGVVLPVDAGLTASWPGFDRTARR
jgi:NAD(P)-dependent dehydrogenase (short-subunit alcohol dehydrogenase family)